MQNIELKVKVDDLIKARGLLGENDANKEGVLHQIDTYFNTKKGRLKTRIINDEAANFIFYERPDQSESKVSEYEMLVFGVSEALKLQKILTATNGVRVVVEKDRELWLWKHTRIHLDVVKGLGEYLELETVVAGISMEEAEQEHKDCVNFLQLEQYEKCEVSYSDLLLIRQAA